MKLHKKTKRLTLRPLELADYDVWKSSIDSTNWGKNKFDVIPKIALDPSKNAFRKSIERSKKDRKSEIRTALSIFRNDTKEWIGAVQIAYVNRGFLQSAIIGYYLLNPHWGQGFGKEAVKAGLEIGFKQMKLHRLWAPIDPKNYRSQKLAKSLGMRREGLSKKLLEMDGKWQDFLVYAMTKEEF